MCIAVGLALIVLPGPLTIPPVLLGLWIWSREFEFAHRLLEPVQEKAREAWQEAKARPVATAAITTAGLVGAAVVTWAFIEYELLEKALETVGL